MIPSENITWQVGESDDAAMLRFIPHELRDLVEPSGGFILAHGAIHFRGCSNLHPWNSLARAERGDFSIQCHFPAVDIDDIPFAQDQVGDQYLLRAIGSGYKVFHLDAETGEVTKFADSLSHFIDGITTDLEDYLNVSTSHRLEPGFLLHAYPPFCTRESGISGSSLRPVPADELLFVHAEFAKTIGTLEDGETFRVQLTE